MKTERIVSNPEDHGWEFVNGKWIWASGRNTGHITDGDTQGQITTWDDAVKQWTPEGAVVVDGGSVGIGTNTPLRKLHISEDAGSAFLQVTTQDDASSGGILMGSSSNPTVGQVFHEHATDSMRVVTSGDERLIVDADGNVDFLSKLEIKQADHGTATSQTGAITFPRVSGGYPDLAAVFGQGDGALGVAGREGLTFYTGGDTSYRETVERMTINGNGDVSFKNATMSQSSTAVQAYFIQSNNAGCTLYSGVDGADTGLFGTSTGHSIAFMTNNVKRMTMDVNGRVDITGSLYVNGTPKIGTSELIETLSTLRTATQDETIDVRQALASACDKLIEKFEAMQDQASTQDVQE